MFCAVGVRTLAIALRPNYWRAMSGWSAAPLVACVTAGAIAGTIIAVLTKRYPPAGALLGATAAFVLCLLAAEILIDASGLNL